MTENVEPRPKAQPVKLSLSYKLFWGLGGFAVALILSAYSALLPIFYQDYLSLQAKWIALASTIFAVWNAINDPLFGYLSDNTRSKGGRRIPYLRWGAPIMGITFVLLWLVPPGVDQFIMFLWMLGAMLLYDTAFTVVGLVYGALLPEITESDAERNELEISSGLMGSVGLGLGFAIPEMFRPEAGTASSLLPLQIAMAVIALVSAGLILIMTLKVKERPEFYKVDPPIELRRALKLTFTSKPFLLAVAQNFMAIFVQSIAWGALFYVADYVMQADGMILIMCMLLGMIVGIPVTTLVRKRLGVAGAQQFYLVVGGVGFSLITIAPQALIPVCVAVGGFGLAGPLVLTGLLFSQAADEDELRSGVRREGAFFGVNALLTKPAQSVALALMPFVLEATDFVTREMNQDQIFLDQAPSAILGIRMVAGLFPGLALLLGAVILIWYPLRGERLEAMQEAVLSLHAEKQARLQAQEMDERT